MSWTVRKLIVLALVAGAISAWLSPWRAEAAGPTHRVCVSAHAHPHQHAAKACRARGWVIKRWVVITPRHRAIAWFNPRRTCEIAEASDTLQRGCVFPPGDPRHAPGWLTTNRRTGIITIHHLRGAR